MTDNIRRVLLSWLAAVTIEVILLPEELRNLSILDGTAQMSLSRVLVLTCILVAVCFLCSRIWDTCLWERAGFPVIFSVLSFLMLRASYSKSFMTVCLCVFTVLLFYAVFGWNGSETMTGQKNMSPVDGGQSGSRIIWGKEKKDYFRITIGFAFFIFLLIAGWTVARVRCFSTPTYDFGIFAQMFYNMKESGLPMTTVERDGLLSHFYVHMSPVYYLMLPFYWLCPKPEMLQILQAAVMVSSVIPLWKIGRKHGLSQKHCMLISMLLLLYPAFGGGAGYDIHENCFLTPLILWLFYGLDSENVFITAGAGLLTLAVKEDAAVYVAVISLWFLVRELIYIGRKRIKNICLGLGLMAAALVWFFLVTGFLAEIGDGVMSYRYNNFIYDSSGSLFSVVKAVLMNPMKAVYECVDLEKHKYLIMTLFPLLGIPLFTRKYERYILLIPYVLVNLMSDYTYQHDIFFQYNFGSVACLFYLVIVNLADWKKEHGREWVLTGVVLLSSLFFAVTIVPKAEQYMKRALIYDNYYDNIRSVLSVIPKDASVTASTFYTTELSQREVLYDIMYSSKEHLLETEYVVLDPRFASTFRKYETDEQENGYENLMELLEKNDYQLHEEIEGVLEIYRKQVN